MKHNYLYIITNPSSECRVFVYANSRSEADLMAYSAFGEKAHFAGLYSDDEADNMGFDTY